MVWTVWLYWRVKSRYVSARSGSCGIACFGCHGVEGFGLVRCVGAVLVRTIWVRYVAVRLYRFGCLGFVGRAVGEGSVTVMIGVDRLYRHGLLRLGSESLGEFWQ